MSGRPLSTYVRLVGAAALCWGALAFQAIRQVGNYGEIYELHFGSASDTPLPRAANRLLRDGGPMYAPSFR